VLRATLWETAEDRDELIGVIDFSVDDQSPEDLAVGLDRLRATTGVVEVLQSAAMGKKGRMAVRVEVLCARERLEAVARLCLGETSTIGVRLRVERRIILKRDQLQKDGVRLKRVVRPDGGTTTKAEMDDLAAAGDRAARERRRRALEGD
jgi:uncharacterized protein (DUF111 family)